MRDLPPVQTLDGWAASDPEAAAVWDRRGCLTYAEWDAAADHLAEFLHRRGIGAGDRVAVRTRIRREWFLANRAIGKLGAEQVAVNVQLSATELRDVLSDSGARALILDDPTTDVAEAVVADGRLTVLLHVHEESTERPTWDAAVSGSEATARVRRPTPLRTPLLIFTSGTTGRPKGVSWFDRIDVDGRRREAYAEARFRFPPRPTRSRALLTMPLHHAGGPADAEVTHGLGGTAYLLDRFDAQVALELIHEHDIDHWLTVPTMLLRVQSLPEAVLAEHLRGSIQSISTGGAPVPQALKEWVLTRFGPVLWSQYGSTETAAIAALDPKHVLSRPGACGRPLPGVEVRIVDPVWNDVPTGRAGEIAVRSPGVVRRYVGRKALGPEALSADGFLRTGDVGHVDEDGFLYITDRVKDMIVSGGTNIYPAEVEAALQEHAAVLEAAVIGVPHNDLGEQPVAFVELVPGAVLDPADLDVFLQGRLAKYKRPRVVEVVESLPRNATGKVTKALLRDEKWAGAGRRI